MKVNKLNMRPWHVMKICGAKGIIFGWVWCVFERCHVLEFLYWQYIVWFEDREISQVLRLATIGHWAGFCSQGRGLAWDRRSRYGQK